MDMLDALLEFQNSSIHILRQSETIKAPGLQECGAASLKNFALSKP